MSRHRLMLVVAAPLVLAGFVLVQARVVDLPDVEGALAGLSDTLGAWTYALVAGLAFLETGAFVGLVAPGETAIVLGGVVAAQGGVSLPLILVLAWVAAAAGDLASYTLGRKLGRKFLVAHGRRLGVGPGRLAKVEKFFARHGGKAILIGRFVGIVRAVAPFTAGASRLPLREFVPWSLAGTAVWAWAFTMLGYVFHRSFEEAAHLLTRGAFAAAVIAVVVLVVRRIVRDRRARDRGPAPLPPAAARPAVR